MTSLSCSKVREEPLRNDVQQIQATSFAFAALRRDGTVVTWGDRGTGGDSNSVEGQLRDVQQIHGSAKAFAAILGDGSLVAWGDAEVGGDLSRKHPSSTSVRRSHLE